MISTSLLYLDGEYTAESPIMDALKWDTLFTKDTVVGPKIFPFIVPIHFCSPKEDKLLAKDNMTSPKCPLFRDSTVYSCNIYTVDICTRVLHTL